MKVAGNTKRKLPSRSLKPCPLVWWQETVLWLNLLWTDLSGFVCVCVCPSPNYLSMVPPAHASVVLHVCLLHYLAIKLPNHDNWQVHPSAFQSAIIYRSIPAVHLSTYLPSEPYVSICIPIVLSIYLSIYLSILPSVFASFCLSNVSPIGPIGLFVRLSTHVLCTIYLDLINLFELSNVST